jgi:hypothetical protein
VLAIRFSWPQRNTAAAKIPRRLTINHESLLLADIDSGTSLAIYLKRLLNRLQIWPDSSLRLPATAVAFCGQSRRVAP